jgi:hypothetical protein
VLSLVVVVVVVCVKVKVKVKVKYRDRWQGLVNTVMNFRVPQNAGDFLTSWEPVSFSRRPLLRGVR